MLDKEKKHPLIINNEGLKSVIYLKHFITKEHIKVGDYTYYHSENDPTTFETSNVLQDIEGLGLQLQIGKFCQIASDTQFLCAYGEHHIHSFTTYPLFWKDSLTTGSIPDRSYFHNKGTTIIDHDVWFGHNSLIMPGIHIGSGAIIATRSVVTKDVPPYAIVGGNPARIIRMRFDEETIQSLLNLRWWDWPIEQIEASYQLLLDCNLEELWNIKSQL
ncbi:CatB-related O-acetyltransferase [Entomospira entomophila]|uniref:CatB-related O-acetyltransferase n=1 Tax=Entomospira entomophila TaxID=2719988 RepID=A0A968GDY3_9SPIO|nr:CatB-related O-acetyltransferase [Entomospira entomophilus]NIZ40669.1 CatB-related O-acetyltransferase [Entomospira entomophilus]WDI34883.1 CatB-related O-acetyltransferase [Entomospira entomophilus]